ncbi:MAG: SAM-dependent methyltransferase [Lachnospiraceae bacterium]|nr:SAM-dependent methyltransferase [Lachnospiraceae bacterium]
MVLPEKFKESMKMLLPGEYEDLIGSFEKRPYSGLKVNTKKISVSDFENKAPFRIEKIPYIKGGYYINDTDAWTKHPYYYAGLYYIQEPSAMLPAEILPVSEDDTVLDICAAPGGKSFGIIRKRPACLLSNDISFSRTIPLVKNIEHTGWDNIFISCESPEKLSRHYIEVFDRIIVDAPCSGEGMFRKDPSLIKEYEKKGSSHYRPVQESILSCVYPMLKAGGYLMYSTCTFSDEENEQVVLAFITEHPDMQICDIEGIPGLRGPYDRYSGYSGLSGCVHVLPHRFCGEGHFMALMKKSEDSEPVPAGGADISDISCGYESLPESIREFFDHLSDDRLKILKSRRYLTSGDGFVYILPNGFEKLYDKKIRYVRTGTCIGFIKPSGAFTPHTAFALSLDMNDFRPYIDLDIKDVNVIKYLKGETIIDDRAEDKGYVLICTDGYPLGFARSDGKRLKNLYEKGWVIR